MTCHRHNSVAAFPFLPIFLQVEQMHNRLLDVPDTESKCSGPSLVSDVRFNTSHIIKNLGGTLPYPNFASHARIFS